MSSNCYSHQYDERMISGDAFNSAIHCYFKCTPTNLYFKAFLHTDPFLIFLLSFQVIKSAKTMSSQWSITNLLKQRRSLLKVIHLNGAKIGKCDNHISKYKYTSLEVVAKQGGAMFCHTYSHFHISHIVAFTFSYLP